MHLIAAQHRDQGVKADGMPEPKLTCAWETGAWQGLCPTQNPTFFDFTYRNTRAKTHSAQKRKKALALGALRARNVITRRHSTAYFSLPPPGSATLPSRHYESFKWPPRQIILPAKFSKLLRSLKDLLIGRKLVVGTGDWNLLLSKSCTKLEHLSKIVVGL